MDFTSYFDPTSAMALDNDPEWLDRLMAALDAHETLPAAAFPPIAGDEWLPSSPAVSLPSYETVADPSLANAAPGPSATDCSPRAPLRFDQAAASSRGRCCDHVCHGLPVSGPSNTVYGHASAGTTCQPTGAAPVPVQQHLTWPLLGGQHVPSPAMPYVVPPANVVSAGPAATATGSGTILCRDVASIPPGRQPSKILKCGIAGCPSTKLFDRKYELKRHMEAHWQGTHPCTVEGCLHSGVQAFTRKDKLVKHLREEHGITI